MPASSIGSQKSAFYYDNKISMRGYIRPKFMRIRLTKTGQKSYSRTNIRWNGKVEKDENRYSVYRLKNGIKT